MYAGERFILNRDKCLCMPEERFMHTRDKCLCMPGGLYTTEINV